MKTKSFFLLVILLTGALCANSTTYYVRCTGLDSDAGTSEQTAFATLSKVFGSTVTLADGDIIDIGEGAFSYNSKYGIAVNLTIKGAGKNLTSISGTQAGAVAKNYCFTIGAGESTPTVVIEDLTFKDFGRLGEATDFATNGGVLYFTGPTAGGTNLTCRRVDFVNNRAYRGAAMYIARGGDVTLEDCAFSGNAAVKKDETTDIQPQGGVMYANCSSRLSLTIDRCLFENNSCEYRGATLFLSPTGSVGSTVLVQNSTFTGNAITLSGGSGCIYNAPGGPSNAKFKYINNTFAWNTGVAQNSGGIVIGANSSGNVSFINNIVFGHTGTTNGFSVANGVFFEESRNNITDAAFDFTAKTLADASSGNQRNVTGTALALAASPTDNGGHTKTLAIGENSIAKNAGYTTGAPAVDQTGYTRQNPDVGAYEYRSGNLTPILQHKKKDIKYSQEKGHVIFNNTDGYGKVSIFTAAGQSLYTKTLSSSSFEYAAGTGAYIFLFEGDNGREESFKIVVTN
jgi:hypothetical protein